MPPVDHAIFRKAVTAALDRELLVALVTKGYEQSATTFTPPVLLGLTDSKAGLGIKFDPEQACNWLAEAVKLTGGIAPVKELVLAHDSSEPDIRIAQSVKIFLKHHLNLDVKLQKKSKKVDAGFIHQNTSPHLYQVQWTGAYPEAYNWIGDALSVFTKGWDNPDFTRIMESAAKELDSDKRNTLYKQAERLLVNEQCIVAPLYYDTAHWLVKPRLKKWRYSPIGGQQVLDWYFGEQ